MLALISFLQFPLSQVSNDVAFGGNVTYFDLAAINDLHLQWQDEETNCIGVLHI